MKVEQLRQLFVLNDTKFSRQSILNGKVVFYQVDEKLTNEVLKSHLDGMITLGVYPVLNGQTKWFVIDIDTNKSLYHKEGMTYEKFKEVYSEKIDALATVFKNKLNEYGIKAYKEKTGGKGMHLWIFFKPAITVKQAGRAIMSLVKEISYDKETFNVEYFPISETSVSVKLPGGKNLRWGNIGADAFSYMECPLENIEPVPNSLIFQLSNPMEAVFTRCAAFRGLKEKADVERNLRHQERTVIGTMLWGLEDKYIDYTEQYFFQNLSNYDAEITRKNLKKLASSMHPTNCAKMQEYGICSETCKENLNRPSPIHFFYDEANAKKSASLESVAIVNPQDNLIKKNNAYYELSRDNTLVALSNYVIDITHDEVTEEGDASEGGVIESRVRVGKIITTKGEEYDFSIPLDKYHKDDCLVAEIYKVLRLGGSPFIDTKKISKVRQCIDKYGSGKEVRKSKNFGYNPERTVYYTPSVRIDKDSIRENDDLHIDLAVKNQEPEQYLDMALDTEKKGEKHWKDFYKTKIFKLYKNNNLPICTLSHVFDLFIRHYYGPMENDSPYLLWLTGETGVGKSRLLNITQRMFGRFPGIYAFSSTSNRLEYSGYYYKDAIFAVDDFKLSSFKTESELKGITTLFQNYADRAGRSRLTRDIQTRRSYRIRGNMLVNGEDMIQHEASSIARTIAIPVRKADVLVDNRLYNKIQTESLQINEWTPHIIQWCMNLDPNRIRDLRAMYIEEFQILAAGRANAPRLAGNFSKLLCGGMIALEYLFQEDEEECKRRRDEFKEYVKVLFNGMLAMVEDEAYALRFWNTLTELVSVGRLRIAPEGYLPDGDHTIIIGFIRDTNVYILHSMSFKEVQSYLSRINPIQVSPKALADSLYSGGFYTTALNLKKYFNGRQVRCFQLNAEKIAEINREGATVAC